MIAKPEGQKRLPFSAACPRTHLSSKYPRAGLLALLLGSVALCFTITQQVYFLDLEDMAPALHWPRAAHSLPKSAGDSQIAAETGLIVNTWSPSSEVSILL